MGKTSFSASDLSSDMEPGSITTKCQNINILVTSGALIPSLAKCLLYRLDDVISANNGKCFLLFSFFFVAYFNMDNCIKFCFMVQKLRGKNNNNLRKKWKRTDQCGLQHTG